MDTSSRTKLFLIIDQGGHASRATVMDGAGRSVSSSRKRLATRRPGEGRVEHDPGELVATVLDSLAEALDRLDASCGFPVSAGLATQRSTIVCFNGRTGCALSPVISWQDTRAPVDGLAGSREEIHARTGLFLSPHYGAGKLSWCLRNIPAVREAFEAGDLRFGPVSSYLAWRLTRAGGYLADPVSASRTLLYNIHNRSWDGEMLRLFGVPFSALPRCVPTIHPFGDLEGPRASMPLRMVTGDQSAALYATGRLRRDTAYVNIGTGAFVSRYTGQQPLIAPRLLTSITHLQGQEVDYVMEGTVNGAGSAVSRARELLGIEKLWEELPAWLEEVKDPPLFLNGVSGLAAPYWDPGFPTSFVGEGSAPGKMTAVVESIAFLLHRNLMEMERFLPRPEKIVATGGLAALDGLCRRLADLSGLPVYRPSQIEATSRGACYLLAGRPPHWPEEAPGRWFEPGDAPSLQGRYGRWRRAMERQVRR